MDTLVSMARDMHDLSRCNAEMKLWLDTSIVKSHLLESSMFKSALFENENVVRDMYGCDVKLRSFISKIWTCL